MHSGYISDGYTERAFIAGIPRLHPPVHLTYRPFLQEERHRLLTENGKLPPAKASLNTANVLAKKIQSWDLADAKGEPVKVDAEAIRRLKPALLSRLVEIVMGLEPSDEDPDAGMPDDISAGLADELAAMETGKAIADVKAASDQKN